MSLSIVVGVDGSKPSLEALQWAAQQARMTGASLVVVAAWHFPASLGWAPAWGPDWDPAAEAAGALSKVVVGALGKDHGLEVQQQVVEGHPAAVLVEMSKDADLLVVGCRGRGEFAGMVLGSVSAYCASHASCPVVIVRHSNAATGESSE
jgi:nucleotide-binding universal stress UspA family protein